MCIVAEFSFQSNQLWQNIFLLHLIFDMQPKNLNFYCIIFTSCSRFLPSQKRQNDRFVTGIQGKMNHSKSQPLLTKNPRLEPGGKKQTSENMDMMWLKWWDIHNLRPHLQYPFPQQLRSIQITVGLVSPKKWSKRKHMYWNTTKIPIWIQKVLWNHQQNYPLLCLSSLLSKDPSTLRAPKPIPLVVVASVHGSVRGPPARRVVSEGSKTAVTWNLKVGKKQNQIYKANMYIYIYIL